MAAAALCATTTAAAAAARGSNALSNTMRRYMAKDVRFGVESRSLVLAGCNKLADAVQVTLGPKVRASLSLCVGRERDIRDDMTVQPEEKTLKERQCG